MIRIQSVAIDSDRSLPIITEAEVKFSCKQDPDRLQKTTLSFFFKRKQECIWSSAYGFSYCI